MALLPTPPLKYDQSFLRQLVSRLESLLAITVNKDTATPYFMVKSTGGKVYKVTVSDLGVLTTTYIQG